MTASVPGESDDVSSLLDTLEEQARVAASGTSSITPPPPTEPASADAVITEVEPAEGGTDVSPERVDALQSAINGLVKDLSGPFQQELGNNIAVFLGAIFKPQLDRIEAQLAELRSGSVAPKPPTKPEFEDAVFDAIGALSVEDRGLLSGGNEDNEDIETLFFVLISSLLESYPEVEEMTMKRGIIGAIQAQKIEAEYAFVTLALDNVLSEIYGRSGGIKLLSLRRGEKRTKESKAPKHAAGSSRFDR